MRRRVVFLVLCVMLGAAATGRAIEIEVDAGAYDRVDTPVAFDMPQPLSNAKYVRLTRIDSGEPIVIQREPGAPQRIVWLVGQRIEAGAARRYKLEALDGPDNDNAEPDHVHVQQDEKKIEVAVRGRTVMRYHIATNLSPIAGEPYYQRSGYIHPLYTPAGDVVTDDFNPDHPHQHGVMFAWTDTTFEGRKVDFWNQQKLEGTVEHEAVLDTVDGPVFGQFDVALRHVNLSAPGGRKVALRETWQVRVYDLTDYFLFDLTSIQSCAGPSPLYVNKYHYGGMAIRGAREWTKDHCQMLTSAGEDRLGGNHTRPYWVDISGPVGHDEAAGVAILQSPDDFRYPQYVRLHPQMPYFVYSPQVDEGFVIEPGKPYVSQYRFYIHKGAINTTEADHLAHDYQDPPKIRVIGP
ncbi:MAG: hypothetical protein GC162_12140 [Planctomycetes bacterium]|nr:hypothetical protein [Planctomycetota bacterium]